MKPNSEEIAEALRLYDKGIPVAITNPQLEHLCQQHRGGKHLENPNPRCPVCQREEGDEAA